MKNNIPHVNSSENHKLIKSSSTEQQWIIHFGIQKECVYF